jgi:hypothetical protein
MSQGLKADAGKIRMGLLYYQFANALKGVANVLTFGARKYPCTKTKDRSWMNVPDAIARYSDAFARHFNAVSDDLERASVAGKFPADICPALDKETGQLEIDHCITNLLFLRQLLYGSNVHLDIIPPAAKELTDELSTR